MKNAHKRLKKKRNRWLSGWVVEVHRHHTKAPSPGSRTQNVLWCYCFVSCVRFLRIHRSLDDLFMSR